MDPVSYDRPLVNTSYSYHIPLGYSSYSFYDFEIEKGEIEIVASPNKYYLNKEKYENYKPVLADVATFENN